MPSYSTLQAQDNRWYNPNESSTIREMGQKQEEDLRLAETAYGELQSKASMLEKLANDVQGKDSQAYQNLMNYAKNLRSQTDLLATQGLNPAVWRNIMQAKNDYGRIVTPIEEAWNEREKLAEWQKQYLEKHPSAVFERDAHDIGIDQMIKHRGYKPKVIDTEDVAKTAQGRYEALKNQATQFVTEAGGLSALTKDPTKLRQWVKVNVPWLYDSKYTTGVDPDEIKRLMAGDPSLQEALTAKIAEETIDMYGVNGWNTDYDHWTNEQNAQRRSNILRQIQGAVYGSSPYSIGETKFEKYDDGISADLYKQSKELAFRASEAEADRAWREKMAAIASGGGGNGETINVDDAAALNPEKIEGDLDHQGIINLANRIKSIDAGNGTFDDVTSTNLSDAIEDVAKELNVEPKELDYSNPEIINKISKVAHDKKLSSNYKWEMVGESFSGAAKVIGNFFMKFNPIGTISQAIGAIKHSNSVAANVNENSDGAFTYFLKSMVGMSGDDLLNAKKNYEVAEDYSKLSVAQRSVKDAKKLYSGDTPLDKKSWLKSFGTGLPTQEYNNETAAEYINKQYDNYVTNYNNDKHKLKDAEDKLSSLEKEMINKGRIEMANTTIAKELKNYGYTSEMEKKGISPKFYSDMLVTGNLMNWDRFESSVLNETSLKDVAQNFNNMITDRENPKYVKIYEFDPKTGATDRVKTEDWMEISGADPQKKEAGQTPVFSTNAKHGLLTVTYKDKNGKPVMYVVKENDLTRHPGFDKKILETIKQEHKIYKLLSNPKDLVNMPQEEKDVYTKSLFKGMDEETKAYHIRNACAAYLAETRPYIKNATQLNNELENLSNTEIETIILRYGLHASLSGMNHDNLNRVVLDMLWGKNSSNTATARKEIYESWMRNN